MESTNFDRELISGKKRFQGYPKGVVPKKGIITVIRDEKVINQPESALSDQ